MPRKPRCADSEYILEHALDGDFAFVKAWKADPEGNLVFRKTARNHNPAIATAGRITIAEVEEIVPMGEIPPDQVHIPGIYVNRVVQAERMGLIERLTLADAPSSFDPAAAPGDSSSFLYPVRCKSCQAEVGVMDEDEVFHFFDVLPSNG